MPNQTVLLVDHDLFRGPLAERLRSKGYTVFEAASGTTALTRLGQGCDVLVLEYQPTGTNTILRKIAALNQDLVIVLLTRSNNPQAVIDAIEYRAHCVACDSFTVDEIAAFVLRVLETTRGRGEVQRSRTSGKRPYRLQRIIGNSAATDSLRRDVARAAANHSATVLLNGESGTGKDLVARIIHHNSDRATKPFVNINCWELPELLLESELFGGARGAFAGADVQKSGLLEVADGGTVFLEHVDDMPPTLQVKLLRFIEELIFKPIGGSSHVRADVRVIAATTRNLEEEVTRSRFSADLYYRLNVPIVIPPLRARPEDIPLLVAHFVDEFNTEFRKCVLGSTPDACTLLQKYHWPGNIRELRNATERAVLLSKRDHLEPADFSTVDGGIAGGRFELPAGGLNLETLERDLVIQALRRCGGNKTRGGALLGLNRYQIRYRMEKFALNTRRARAVEQG